MRPLPLLLFSGILALAPLRAAEIDTEDFNHLQGRVNAQDESIETFRVSLRNLRDEIARLRSDNETLRSQLGNVKNLATQEQLTRLTDQVRDVEKNRVKDKEQILEAIEKLKVLPPVVIPDPPKPTPTPTPKVADKPADKPDKASDKVADKPADKPEKPADPGPDLPTEYYEHKVAEGDTLGAIIQAYNKQNGLKVRIEHVLKANPKLKDPKRLRVGDTIRIPAVK